MTSRIGFFAGTFDPIHDGHLEVARSSVKYLELDQLYFMVESKPWGDKHPVAANHRQQMVDLAIDSHKKISQLKELLPQFSIDKTLPKLKARFPESELYFVFGGDVFIHINDEQWPGLAQLEMHHIVVFERAGVSNSDIEQHARELGIAVAIIPSIHAQHTSSNVRLKPHEKSIWVPGKVSKYIDKNKLYRS